MPFGEDPSSDPVPWTTVFSGNASRHLQASISKFKFSDGARRRGDAGKRAATDEQRMYPVGRFLRRTGLYEIPQFVNVVLGYMSVVGPRPHTIIYNRRFSEIVDEYNVRTRAKPGITGLAQISGYRSEPKDDCDVRERAKLDIKYIQNWSLPFCGYFSTRWFRSLGLRKRRIEEACASEKGFLSAIWHRSCLSSLS
jgi:lipopolysaccharide/colanic/teichoic acid biosynthesis glycosyltransferase